MYHTKYDESRARDTTHWWVTAGLCGMVVTLAFVGLTLWLGMEEPRQVDSTEFRYSPPPQGEPRGIPRPPRGRIEKVHKEEEKSPTRLKLPIPQAPPMGQEDTQEIRTYKGTLHHGEELMNETGVKESSIKKKSEAVFPSGFDPDMFLSHGIFGADNRRDDLSNDFESHERPEIPPFSYIREPNEVEDRIDDAPGNSFLYPDSSVENFGDDTNSLTDFFKKSFQEVRDWLMTRGDQTANSEWLQLLSAFNQSVIQRNLTAIMTQLKDMYNSSDVADVPVSSLLYPDARNGSSLLSFGLLAIDLFLLHNVQQIAWNEQDDRMLDDPEVVAMNALFLPPDRLRQLHQKGSRVLKTSEDKSVLTETLEFVNSMLRAILNLNKAFRRSGMARETGPNTMDCIWTLYCRNLDKTAKLQGPYGFLAKMNSLGLRLMMGEFPADKAFSQLLAEATSGWRPIDCQRLFPRCSVDEAKDVVMNTVLGEAPATFT
ncbi:LOW QUALITY PROTEIN: uncharacterized protein LOC124353153 [Homalodisca vitripennis]|uniref:LOW QUALITY PROTEIN: uncharacterized protein LOC124353153 n=1 Tax=Homalodisca vitripennis TaxID=197043 RepID=UPI001EEB7839|nr:LOW QUALITY PROTEIN: uncharacterized protein LOC124353153 [Homalodisca vitripennis]